MANELLLQALQELRARRYDNEAEQQRRKAHAEALCPRIAELERERLEDILRGLQMAMEGVTPEGIQHRTKARNTEIAKLLREHGLDETYLGPVYQCGVCEDSGYVGETRKTLCGCVLKRFNELLCGDEDSDISPSFERFDLSVFPETVLDSNGTTQRRLMELIRRHCERYADAVPLGKLNLLLYGPSGLGKTYLLKAIARRAREHGVQTLVFNANALLNQIRQAYFARDAEPDQPYYDIPFLLIDDLGTEPLWENITLEQLFALIEYRIEHQKSTVLSSNLSLDNLRERYTRRIYSRLMDQRLSVILQFQGEDIRLIPRG